MLPFSEVKDTKFLAFPIIDKFPKTKAAISVIELSFDTFINSIIKSKAPLSESVFCVSLFQDILCNNQRIEAKIRKKLKQGEKNQKRGRNK